MVVFLAIASMPIFRRSYGLWEGCRWDAALMWRLLRFGGPNGLQMFFEIATFTALTFLMGRLGETAMAATTVAFSVNAIAFVPMLGLGIAVSAMVGQQLGANRPELAVRATWTAYRLGLIYTGVMALLFVTIPDGFLMAHAVGRTSEFEQVAALCRVLMRFVAAYCVIDMAQVVFSSAVKCAGDTRFVLATTAAVAPLPALVGWFGLRAWGWGLIPLWSVLTVYIFVIGLIFFLASNGGLGKACV